MAAITARPSLDEYYDLTAEEEALLCEIDIQAASLDVSSGLTGGRVLFEESRSHGFTASVVRCGSGDRDPGFSPCSAAAPTTADAAVADALYPDRKCPVAKTKEESEAAGPTD